MRHKGCVSVECLPVYIFWSWCCFCLMFFLGQHQVLSLLISALPRVIFTSWSLCVWCLTLLTRNKWLNVKRRKHCDPVSSGWWRRVHVTSLPLLIIHTTLSTAFILLKEKAPEYCLINWYTVSERTHCIYIKTLSTRNKRLVRSIVLQTAIR